MKRFERFVPFYDQIVRLFFGNLLLQAQCITLNQVDGAKRILVVGGGSGAILTHLLLRFPEAQITYLETSETMLLKAKQRFGSGNRVSFVCADAFTWSSTEQFDLIFLPFMLDFYSTNQVNRLLNKLLTQLDPMGNVVVVDFGVSEQSVPLQHLMIKVMYWWFNWLGVTRQNRLPDYNGVLSKHLTIIKSMTFGGGVWKGFVFGIVGTIK